MAQPLYFDNAASTPLDPRVLRTMRPYFLSAYGNPGSLHSFGQSAIAAVDLARETIARLLGAEFRNVIFTSSATEANNIAFRGVLRSYRDLHPGVTPRVIISSIEHESVLETARSLRQEGVDVVELPVGRTGIVDQKSLQQALTAGALLVSVMYANNEIGTLAPLQSIARIINDHRSANNSPFPLFHTDASQAFQFLDCSVDTLGVDLMTLSSHKLYGPKGVGVLYLRNGVRLTPFITGGGQEFGIRSGTENVPGIVGCASAMDIAHGARATEVIRVQKLAEHFMKQVHVKIPKAVLNGEPLRAAWVRRLPNIINVYLPGHTAADVVMQCDLNGLAISSGSACASRSYVPSYVLKALGYGVRRASESVRISMGRFTTKADVDRAVLIIRKSIQ